MDHDLDPHHSILAVTTPFFLKKSAKLQSDYNLGILDGIWLLFEGLCTSMFRQVQPQRLPSALIQGRQSCEIKDILVTLSRSTSVQMWSEPFSMITLDRLKNDWESLAEHDSLHAILTDATKVGGQWNIADFMATGNAEIEMLMRHLAGLGYISNRDGVALDFGCGVGRLTQALGHYFDSCMGVDISEAMIQQAQSFNELPHCRYLATSSIPLPFPTDTFSFVYSNIVLQHIPRHFTEKYLRELIRVLKPGGLLVFGVQDSYAMRNLSSLLTRLRHVIHIRSRIRVALRIGAGDMQMHCLPERTVRHVLGASRVLDVQFTNTAAKDFNGRLVYLQRAPRSGYISKQYCVVK